MKRFSFQTLALKVAFVRRIWKLEVEKIKKKKETNEETKKKKTHGRD